MLFVIQANVFVDFIQIYEKKFWLKENISRPEFSISSLVWQCDSVIESSNKCLRGTAGQMVKACYCTTAADVSVCRAVCFYVTQILSFVEMDVYVGKLMSLSAIAFERALQLNKCIGMSKYVCTCTPRFCFSLSVRDRVSLPSQQD